MSVVLSAGQEQKISDLVDKHAEISQRLGLLELDYNQTKEAVAAVKAIAHETTLHSETRAADLQSAIAQGRRASSHQRQRLERAAEDLQKALQAQVGLVASNGQAAQALRTLVREFEHTAAQMAEGRKREEPPAEPRPEASMGDAQPDVAATEALLEAVRGRAGEAESRMHGMRAEAMEKVQQMLKKCRPQLLQALVSRRVRSLSVERYMGELAAVERQIRTQMDRIAKDLASSVRKPLTSSHAQDLLHAARQQLAQPRAAIVAAQR